MIAPLVRSADFERVLRTRTQAHSLHFALHHVAERPSVSERPPKRVDCGELSTSDLATGVLPVDESSEMRALAAPGGVWLGTVVPKRHARRSVTRTLLKRQMRAVVAAHAAALAGGLWVLRLRAPFDRARFVSAASDELKRLARVELEQLMLGAVRRLPAAR